MKKWQIHQPSEEAAKQIRSSSDLSMLCAQVLAARGMHNVQESAAFLQCDGLADPFLTADMEAAAACINTALDDGSRICIYGDYDADGVTATSLLGRCDCHGDPVLLLAGNGCRCDLSHSGTGRGIRSECGRCPRHARGRRGTDRDGGQRYHSHCGSGTDRGSGHDAGDY